MKIMVKAKLARYLVVVGISLLLLQCGKEGKEKDFAVTVTPNHPLVRVTERKLGDTTINPNWFDVSLTLTNNTDQHIRIDEILFYVTVDGEEASPFSPDLGQLQHSDEEGNTYDYVGYCVYPPGLSHPLGACLTNSTLVNAGPGSGVAPAVKTPITSYIDSVGEQLSGSKVYRVRGELLGVFLSGNTETDRFQKRFNFTTR